MRTKKKLLSIAESARTRVRGRINEELAKSKFDFVFSNLIEFASDWSRNESPSRHYSELLRKIKFNKQVKKILIWSNFGEFCAPRIGMFYVTEAGHANWCHVVGGLRGEKPSLREAGAPEQPQRSLRRPLAQPRPLATLRNQSKPPHKPNFRRPAPRKLHDQLPHHDFAQKFDRYIPVAVARVGRRGGA